MEMGIEKVCADFSADSVKMFDCKIRRSDCLIFSLSNYNRNGKVYLHIN